MLSIQNRLLRYLDIEIELDITNFSKIEIITFKIPQDEFNRSNTFPTARQRT